MSRLRAQLLTLWNGRPSSGARPGRPRGPCSLAGWPPSDASPIDNLSFQQHRAPAGASEARPWRPMHGGRPEPLHGRHSNRHLRFQPPQRARHTEATTWAEPPQRARGAAVLPALRATCLQGNIYMKFILWNPINPSTATWH